MACSRRRELRRRGRYAEGGIVTGFEPGGELFEVALETIPRRGTVGLLHGEVDGVAVELALRHTLPMWCRDQVIVRGDDLPSLAQSDPRIRESVSAIK